MTGAEPIRLLQGDCLEWLPTLPDESIDAIVTDPPYGLGFMGKKWDELPPGLPWARECLRVLKPGGHLLAFGGTRTSHRLAAAVEDAGFEIRDSIAWLYGSGFPKSLDVSKAITATQTHGGASSVMLRRSAMGLDYVVSGKQGNRDGPGGSKMAGDGMRDVDLTDDARTWTGWGTALKPAFEPIIVGRKPLVGTVAANVLAHGTGALHIDACRVPAIDKAVFPAGIVSSTEAVYGAGQGMYADRPRPTDSNPAGRWPTNVLLDEGQAAALDQQTGTLTSGTRKAGTYAGLGYQGSEAALFPAVQGNEGGASRFFPTFKYQAKAPGRERPNVDGIAHPTVKPLELMRWLVRLVCPPGAVLLDPFAGSGTTLQAAQLEGVRCIGIEREESYIPLILARCGEDVPVWLREEAS